MESAALLGFQNGGGVAHRYLCVGKCLMSKTVNQGVLYACTFALPSCYHYPEFFMVLSESLDWSKPELGPNPMFSFGVYFYDGIFPP